MELERARSLLNAERARVQQLLADLGTDRTDDHEAERDASYPATPLAQEGVDDAVAAGLRNRLGGLDRAFQRVEDGSYGRSIRSGGPIPGGGPGGGPRGRPRLRSSLPRRPWMKKQRADNEGLMPKAARVQVSRVYDR